MDKKYEILKDQAITMNGSTIYRIKALKDFGDVKDG
nr:MAG TPA: Putative transferase, nesg, ydcK, Structural Genomics.38A [Caudoviricetes sp.]